jgi:hypothetical protein
VEQAVRFDSLSMQEKIDFFVKCQQLLLTHHPNSPFLFRQDNAQRRLAFVKPMCEGYKGFCYSNDNVCIIFNKIWVPHPEQIAQSIVSSQYQPPAQPYNTALIDFVVFRELKDCWDLVSQQFDANLQYIAFVRHNQVRIYPIMQFFVQGLGIKQV